MQWRPRRRRHWSWWQERSFIWSCTCQNIQCIVTFVLIYLALWGLSASAFFSMFMHTMQWTRSRAWALSVFWILWNPALWISSSIALRDALTQSGRHVANLLLRHFGMIKWNGICYNVGKNCPSLSCLEFKFYPKIKWKWRERKTWVSNITLDKT